MRGANLLSDADVAAVTIANANVATAAFRGGKKRHPFTLWMKFRHVSHALMLLPIEWQNNQAAEMDSR